MFNKKKIISQNNKVYYNYRIEKKIEAGISLLGYEVKSIRFYGINITRSYVFSNKGELFLANCEIKKYFYNNSYSYKGNRKKKFLLNKKEIQMLTNYVEKKSFTILPLSVYINNKNYIKIVLGIGKSKKKYDKRDIIKNKECKKKILRYLKYD